MNLRIVSAVVAFLGLSLFGCAAPRVPGATFTSEGTILFSETGSSVIARKDDPLALLEAQLAAATIAEANLLRKLKGADLAGEVTASDLMFTGQHVVSRVEGRLSRVEIHFDKPRGEDGIVTATAMLEVRPRELKSLGRYVQ